MDNGKTLVLFDVGGVLLALNYLAFYQRGAELTGVSSEEFRKSFIDSGIELRALNGDISNEEYQTRLKQLLNRPEMTRRDLEDFVKTMWEREIYDVVDLKERVYFNANCPVNIFSNNNQFAFEYLSRTYPRMMQTFHPELVPICSFMSLGVKPKPMMYNDAQLCAERAGCERIILIDDNANYVLKGIETFGWSGIHFTSHIDYSEAIRSIAGHTANVTPNGSFKVANSLLELEEGLRSFGIGI